ncbi:hypothetical protein PROFUN_09053 [Planoprotostelium fungivorum]|uniref:Uncharacterized protein n=1 Tax=Planoprotostelium fungivorum TaxID=1890364 RepID=A0A2P6NIF6_9EUKA|nr:hypothetical protein PROFUN_09053 [Planoprotostelium fungivorum]
MLAQQIGQKYNYYDNAAERRPELGENATCPFSVFSQVSRPRLLRSLTERLASEASPPCWLLYNGPQHRMLLVESRAKDTYRITHQVTQVESPDPRERLATAEVTAEREEQEKRPDYGHEKSTRGYSSGPFTTALSLTARASSNKGDVSQLSFEQQSRDHNTRNRVVTMAQQSLFSFILFPFSSFLFVPSSPPLVLTFYFFLFSLLSIETSLCVIVNRERRKSIGYIQMFLLKMKNITFVKGLPIVRSEGFVLSVHLTAISTAGFSHLLDLYIPSVWTVQAPSQAGERSRASTLFLSIPLCDSSCSVSALTSYFQRDKQNNTKPLWNELSVRKDRLDLLLTLSQLLEMLLSLRKIIAELKQLSAEKDEGSTTLELRRCTPCGLQKGKEETTRGPLTEKRSGSSARLPITSHQLIHRTTQSASIDCYELSPYTEIDTLRHQLHEKLAAHSLNAYPQPSRSFDRTE